MKDAILKNSRLRRLRRVLDQIMNQEELLPELKNPV
jgi:hypothetical protein